MANKKNNENKNNGMNKKEETKMAKVAKKISINIMNGVINIVKINGEACKEPRRFGVYTKPENGTLPHISIRPKVGGWLNLDAYVAEDENGKLTVAVNHEPDAYWNFAEVILGGKKAVNAAKKALITARKNAIAAKEQQAAQVTENNNIIIGADVHRYVYTQQLPGINEEIVDLGEKFGSRLMKWGKGLDCTKIYNGDKEVAYIFWQKSGKAPRIRLLNEDVKRYYMKAYNQDAFIYYDGDKKVTVMDAKLANALWFFYKNFVLKLAELKGWELPIAHNGMPQSYWDSLEKEYEQEEAAIEAARAAKKNGKA